MKFQDQKKEISLGKDFGDVVLKVNGARIEVSTDGTVKVCPGANDDLKAAACSESKVGDKMADGTVLAGISPDTNKPMYVTPADASRKMTFDEAQHYAAKLDAHGHKDWRVPTRAELNVLFNNRAAIGRFDISGAPPAGWYWSASPGHKWIAWGQRFSDGAELNDAKSYLSSVRPVR